MEKDQNMNVDLSFCTEEMRRWNETPAGQAGKRNHYWCNEHGAGSLSAAGK
jgi:hypothetical protein